MRRLAAARCCGPSLFILVTLTPCRIRLMRTISLVAATLALAVVAHFVLAQEKPAPTPFSVGDNGKLTFTAPASWTKKQPATKIVEAEFATPAKGDEAPGRLTAMGAGGSI